MAKSDLLKFRVKHQGLKPHLALDASLSILTSLKDMSASRNFLPAYRAHRMLQCFAVWDHCDSEAR